MISLTDVLTTGQLRQVSECIETMETAGITPLNPRFEQGLENLLKEWTIELTTKGTRPELLACSIAYIVAQAHMTEG